jgi:predicted signal transduction protein with EAL and GGDEF domain
MTRLERPNDNGQERVAVLDARGKIAWTNAAWRRFTAEHGSDAAGEIGSLYAAVNLRVAAAPADMTTALVDQADRNARVELLLRRGVVDVDPAHPFVVLVAHGCDRVQAERTLHDAIAGQVAERLRAWLRHDDVVVSVGGEAAVLLAAANFDDATRVADRIAASLAVAPLVATAHGTERVSFRTSVFALGVAGDVGKRLQAAHAALAAHTGVMRAPIIALQSAKAVGVSLSSTGDDALAACVRDAGNVDPAFVIHIAIAPTLLSMSTDDWARTFPDASVRKRVVLVLDNAALVNDPRELAEPIACIRALGFRIALAGIGAGRTSIENLVILEPDFVQLDRGAVRGVSVAASRRQQLERLVRAIRAIDAVVMVSFDDDRDAHVCAALGVTLGQRSVALRKSGR